MGDWYYVGNYGQLGPLTRDQIDELIAAQVIAPDTYVWKVGMSDWAPANQAPDLVAQFLHVVPSMPPPPPGPPSTPSSGSTQRSAPIYASYPHLSSLRSDRSRVVAGVLQLLLPGIGRMYLGYWAMGVLQLLASFCFGIGWVISVVDGVLILSGAVRMDGYGRMLDR